MKKIYFTITGTSYRFGQEFMEPGMTVKLVKEPDNEFDKEAIKVEMEGLEPFRARVTAPVVSTTRLEIPSKARLCMFFLREYWHM